jgi:hypothetical protein
MRRKITNETWEQIKTAYASGIGLRELIVKREDTLLAVTPVEAVAMSMQQRGERHIERMAGVSERAVDHIQTMDSPEILKSVDRIDKLDKIGRRTFGLDDAQTQVHQTLVNVNILDS